MAAKPILDIEVNDESFRRYTALFDKYNQQLKKQPAAWQALNKTASGAGDAFAAMTAALLAQNELTRKEVAEQKKLANTADHTARSWTSMARSSKDVAANIGRATVSLLKWT